MNSPWKLLREEPYRLFFPLGLLAGIYGVLLWPLYYAGHLSFHPGEAHTRLMIEGSLGAAALCRGGRKGHGLDAGLQPPTTLQLSGDD